MTRLVNPNELMLLRIAQADAYCMATEYIKLPEHADVRARALEFKAYQKHPTHKLEPGQYTDDTQMSIAITEQLLSGQRLSKLSFADHFMAAFLRDKREGYSRGFQAILESSTSGQELIDRLVPDSTKNGAMMRAVPLGIIPDITELMLAASTQAKVTHDSEEGVVSACATALLSHWGLYSNKPFDVACAHLAKIWPNYRHVFQLNWSGPVKGKRWGDSGVGGHAHDVGINTVWAVATLLRQEDSLLGILRRVIEWGGDTDSVAAVAWGIASSRLHEDLPSFFIDDLELGGRYGSKFLIELGVRLMKYGQGSTQKIEE